MHCTDEPKMDEIGLCVVAYDYGDRVSYTVYVCACMCMQLCLPSDNGSRVQQIPGELPVAQLHSGQSEFSLPLILERD